MHSDVSSRIHSAQRIVNGRTVFFALVAIMALSPHHAGAVQPHRWVHTTEADFSPGTSERTVATNLGDVKLAARLTVIKELLGPQSVIYDMQPMPDGSVYVLAGPELVLLKWSGMGADDEEPSQIEIVDDHAFALAVTERGKLLIAFSAPNPRISVLDDGQLHTIAQLEDVHYVWDILVDGARIYLATGNPAQLLAINTDIPVGEQGGITELLAVDQDNLLCLGQDEQGRLYAGTDSDGIVYRVTPLADGNAEVFVLYDAAEPEIGSLLVQADGTVFAGTADADQAKPGRLEDALTDETGRPETTGSASEPDAGDLPRVPPKPEPFENESPKMPAPPSDTGSGSSPPSRSQTQRGDNASPPTSNITADHPGASVPAFRSSPNALADQSTNQSTPADHGAADPPVSQGQRDRLREVIRARLERARATGEVAPMNQNIRRFHRPSVSASRRGVTAARKDNPTQDGNAIYRINPDGFVSEVFRESVMILKIIEDPTRAGTLLVATGNEGQVFRVDPIAEETALLANLDSQQIVSVGSTQDGRVILGAANPAVIAELETGFTEAGSYMSPILDAGQISIWGKLNCTASTPPGTSIGIETRSGNSEDPERAAWTNWSKPQILDHEGQDQPLTPREATIRSVPARYLQYRLTFQGSGDQTPVVDRVQLTYVVPNLKPVIRGIQASYPGLGDPASAGSGRLPQEDHDAEPVPELEIEWEVEDPNEDRLRYRLEYRPSGSERWLTLAKDLTENEFKWQTRRVPDGWYTLRVTADDSRDNPPDMAKTTVRLSNPILVDNASPEFSPLGHQVEDSVIWIAAEAKDALSPIRAIQYSLDAADDWQPVLPDDLIYDSTRETFTIKITDLPPGPHVVTVRATDVRRNARYQAVLVEIGQ